MTTAQVAERSVTVNNNSPIQDYVRRDDHTQPTHEMTPGLKPFTTTTFIIPHPTRENSRWLMERILKKEIGNKLTNVVSSKLLPLK